jgi:hypothetical protein
MFINCKCLVVYCTLFCFLMIVLPDGYLRCFFSFGKRNEYQKKFTADNSPKTERRPLKQVFRIRVPKNRNS